VIYWVGVAMGGGGLSGAQRYLVINRPLNQKRNNRNQAEPILPLHVAKLYRREGAEIGVSS
jgi:hypothetical protein